MSSVPKRLSASKGRSTGPKTKAGKAISSQNAVRHGMLSTRLLLPGEDQEAYQLLHEGLTSEFAPKTLMQREVLDAMVNVLWRRKRLDRGESIYLADLVAQPVDRYGLAQRLGIAPEGLPAWMLLEENAPTVTEGEQAVLRETEFARLNESPPETDADARALAPLLYAALQHYISNRKVGLTAAHYLQDILGAPSFTEGFLTWVVTLLGDHNRWHAYWHTHRDRIDLAFKALRFQAELTEWDLDKMNRYTTALERQLFRLLQTYKTLQAQHYDLELIAHEQR